MTVPPKTFDDIIERLPARLKGGWTEAEINAFRTGVVEFDQLVKPRSRMRLCTAAGYFNRALLVKGPKKDEPPVFKIVPANAGQERPIFPFANIIEDFVPAVLRVSAAWNVSQITGSPFGFDPADADAVRAATNLRPITTDQPWLITTEAGAVYVYGATKHDTPSATRDGVMAFFETPEMLAQLKR